MGLAGVAALRHLADELEPLHVRRARADSSTRRLRGRSPSPTPTRDDWLTSFSSTQTGLATCRAKKLSRQSA